MFNELKDRISALEHKVDILTKEKTSMREEFLNLMDKTSKLISQTNDRLDDHFKDQQGLSDRLNLAEGMVDIFKNDINDLRKFIFKEEDIDETSS